eukprot:CAMPEP_0202446768 /NCGR_PEP_ID=MMETSP1360-20130828/5334_1 /ASSEMBLY_ACC=CAM_ASM_000848 /TAXON_ID=515479 /ORGANISM="Licmophora paradoxa, Strain CCMP2313" /LENGTH=378 /DNA_ID=CAMNT_0049063447 /DNA_START=62 /DNA_END=1198 /DNA_ORIENTATION=+
MMRSLILISAFKQASSFTSAPPLQSKLNTAIFRLFSSTINIDTSVSRLSTLHTLLNKCGAPGSTSCTQPDDLVPFEDTELELHPHLYPIAKSKSSGNFICGLRRAYADDTDYESSTLSPWPIVESAPGSRGMKVLALNSEHLMRRIACEADEAGNDAVVDLYNDGLGQGQLKEAALDTPYQKGSVEKLGYGVDKFVLLRVGPFPDLYQTMALNHKERSDEASSLIAAEACNGKCVGFGSTFRFYARLLNSCSGRGDEARDAARMCLRMPLPSIGFEDKDFKETAVLAQLAEENDSTEEALAKLQIMWEKIRAKEEEDEQSKAGLSPEQAALEAGNYLLDTVALAGGSWKDIRPKLADIYASAGKDDMALFVDPSRKTE